MQISKSSVGITDNLVKSWDVLPLRDTHLVKSCVWTPRYHRITVYENGRRNGCVRLLQRLPSFDWPIMCLVGR